MQVILTKEEYDELVAKAKPTLQELFEKLVCEADKEFEKQPEIKQLRNELTLNKSKHLWLAPVPVKYRVTVERVEEDE